MFEFSRIKDELEKIKCPQHGKVAKITFKEGVVNLDDVCCEAHRKLLIEKLPDFENLQTVEEIMQDMY